MRENGQSRQGTGALEKGARQVNRNGAVRHPKSAALMRTNRCVAADAMVQTLCTYHDAKNLIYVESHREAATSCRLMDHKSRLGKL